MRKIFNCAYWLGGIGLITIELSLLYGAQVVRQGENQGEPSWTVLGVEG